jgi:hypothetical protein
MSIKAGERVGAILRANAGACEFLGYGVYEGDFLPEEAIGFIAKALVEAKVKNPRIRLDSGSVVYGCECWWGSEAEVKKRLEGYKAVKQVDILEIRKEYLKEDAKRKAKENRLVQFVKKCMVCKAREEYVAELSKEDVIRASALGCGHQGLFELEINEYDPKDRGKAKEK